MQTFFLTLSLFLSYQLVVATNFTLVQDYSGATFFDEWDFAGGYDDTTHGHVNYVNQSESASLAYVNPANRAIIKVDNTSYVSTYPYLEKRNSVRIASKAFFGTGTVFVIDAVHIPFGCSVWPSIWTKGDGVWPDTGEIDIIEGINTMSFNQMALHTALGCTAASGTDETGKLTATNCNTTQGCTVAEQKPNSFGQGFADNSGGVFAAQFDVAGVFMWFCTRNQVPASISTATDSLDISSWGPPSAAYPASSCSTPKYFTAQQLIVDITLCGDWAGQASIYASQCGGNASDPYSCYTKSVALNGSQADLATAYFELNYIRAFTVNATGVTQMNSTSSSSTSDGGSPTSSGPSLNPSASGQSTQSNSAITVSARRLHALVIVLCLFSLTVL